MAVSAFRDKIVASATGASDELFLEAKEEGQDYTLFFIASAWGSATLQISPDNVSWADYEIDVSGVGLSVVTKTKNSTVRAPGDCYYRLNVNSLSGGQPITLFAR